MGREKNPKLGIFSFVVLDCHLVAFYKIWNLKKKTWNLESKSWNLEFRIWNLESRIISIRRESGF